MKNKLFGVISMLDFITFIGIVIGIIFIKFASKKQNIMLKNIGIFIILICLIYIIPDFLRGFVKGMLSVEFH